MITWNYECLFKYMEYLKMVCNLNTDNIYIEIYALTLKSIE